MDESQGSSVWVGLGNSAPPLMGKAAAGDEPALAMSDRYDEQPLLTVTGLLCLRTQGGAACLWNVWCTGRDHLEFPA